jgi:hypothetical protein
MESPIKLLVFALTGLFSYGAEASLQENTNNLLHNNDKITVRLNTASPNKALNHYVASNLSGSDTLVLSRQMPNCEQSNGSYNALSKQNGIYNPDNSDNFISRIQSANYWLKDELMVTSELSMKQGFEASIELIRDVPLPAATWLFLGSLLGILKFQRRKKSH